MFISVRLSHSPHRAYYSLPPTLNHIVVGDFVVLKDTIKEYIYAEVLSIELILPKMYLGKDICPVIRQATDKDTERYQLIIKRNKEVLEFCKLEIKKQKLPMKIIDVEILFSLTKIIIYFSAPDRVDFRDLLKVLISRYNERIELKQINARTEVQRFALFGNCGRESCCSRYLRAFKPITLKIAKEQNGLYTINSTGSCGKFRCCLRYENEDSRE